MNITIKWGFIGCGEATEKKSGPAFNLVKGSEVVAVMGRDKEKTKEYARRHNIPHYYTDAQALIDDPEVNAIYIATPPSSHVTYAIMAMKAGKPVYVEKPLAASYEDCARINRVSRETGIPCFVAYYRRYLPYFQKVKHLISEGANIVLKARDVLENYTFLYRDALDMVRLMKNPAHIIERDTRARAWCSGPIVRCALLSCPGSSAGGLGYSPRKSRRRVRKVSELYYRIILTYSTLI